MTKLILCVHQKGGVGKSTIALNLALNLSDSSKVAILDMDHQGSLLQLHEKIDGIYITNDEQIISNNIEYDFIIIDTPPYLSNALPNLIQVSDLIVIPTKAGILDVLAIKSTLDLVKREKMDSKALIVFNMIKPNTTLTKNIMELVKPFEIPVARTKISDLVAFTRSVALQGVRHHIKAQGQINNLTKEILIRLL
ncbi:MAG: ParA family protein [Maribacter sp.]|uniref:ParA family protein n=1 Tax=Maribacter sp. TaxID=1897614 RepID=UPI00329A0514